MYLQIPPENVIIPKYENLFKGDIMLEYDEIRLELTGMKAQLDDLAEALGLEKDKIEITSRRAIDCLSE